MQSEPLPVFARSDRRRGLSASGDGPAVARHEQLRSDLGNKTRRRLLGVTDQRIQYMDDAGIDIQVISVTTPGTQSLPPAEAVRQARDASDMVAVTVASRPTGLPVGAENLARGVDLWLRVRGGGPR
jgi:hypothetical protein